MSEIIAKLQKAAQACEEVHLGELAALLNQAASELAAGQSALKTPSLQKTCEKTLTYTAALDDINEGKLVNAKDLSEEDLAKVVWIYEWHIPGYMPESLSYFETQEDAIEECLQAAEGTQDFDEFNMRETLKAGAPFQTKSHIYGWVTNTVCAQTLGSLL